MTDAHPDSTYADDEIDLRELFLVLWEGKGLITIVVGLAAIISVVVALSIPNIYKSTAILAPKSDGGTGELSRPRIPVWGPSEFSRYKPWWARG